MNADPQPLDVEIVGTECSECGYTIWHRSTVEPKCDRCGVAF